MALPASFLPFLMGCAAVTSRFVAMAVDVMSQGLLT